MKNNAKFLLWLGLGCLLAACVLLPAPARAPIDVAAVRTSAAATAIVQLTAMVPTATPSRLPSDTPNDQHAEKTSVAATDAARASSSPVPIPLIAQTIEPTQLPGLLKSSMAVESLPAFNGHGLRKIGGWKRGFTSLNWLDTDHLMLAPIIGRGFQGEGGGPLFATEQVVMDLRSGKVWIPAAEKTTWRQDYTGALLPRWSAQLGAVIAQRSEHAVGVYSIDGALLKTINGDLEGVSPGASKLLMADHTWIDLKSGKRVHFNWQQPAHFSPDSFSIRPIWSEDEMRVYTCCYHYGNAATGESQDMPLGDIRIDGKTEQEHFKDSGPDAQHFYLPLYAFYGKWLFNDRYMLVEWGGIWDGSPGFAPLFDPAARTYRSLNTVVGLPNNFDIHGSPEPGAYYLRMYAAYGGRYVWLEFAHADYLVDLATFKSTSYPSYSISDMSWSEDGKFAVVEADLDDKIQPAQILSGESGKLTPVPNDRSCGDWHPSQAILVCGSKDRRTLSLLDAAHLSILKEVTLPISFSQVVWSREGDRIALVAGDNSIWQIDFPGLNNLTQLTPALPGSTYGLSRGSQPRLQNVVWSPDGASLALIGDTDVYIVETHSKP